MAASSAADAPRRIRIRSLYHIRCSVVHRGREDAPAPVISHFSRPLTLRSRARGVPVRVAAQLQLSGLPDPLRRAQVEDSTQLSAPAHLTDALNAYSTRSFLVRYVEEEVSLNEGAVFALELPAAAAAEAMVRFELVWAEVEQDDSTGAWRVEKPFRAVAAEVARIRCPQRGASQYHPVRRRHRCLPPCTQCNPCLSLTFAVAGAV